MSNDGLTMDDLNALLTFSQACHDIAQNITTYTSDFLSQVSGGNPLQSQVLTFGQTQLAHAGFTNSFSEPYDLATAYTNRARDLQNNIGSLVTALGVLSDAAQAIHKNYTDALNKEGASALDVALTADQVDAAFSSAYTQAGQSGASQPGASQPGANQPGGGPPPSSTA